MTKQTKILGALSLAKAMGEASDAFTSQVETTAASVALKNIPPGMLQLSILKTLESRSVVLLLPTVKSVKEWQRQFEVLADSVHFSFGIHPLVQTIFWGHEKLARRSHEIKERSKGLIAALQNKNILVLATAAGLLQKTLAKETYLESMLEVSEESGLDQEKLLGWLQSHGYIEQEELMESGTFCRRGSVVDVYDPHIEKILRIEFFGDEIDSIRLASPETLRTLEKVKKYELAPGTELFYGKSSKVWAQCMQDYFLKKSTESTFMHGVVESFLDKTAFTGDHQTIPILSGESVCALDYFEHSTFIAPESLDQCTDDFQTYLESLNDSEPMDGEVFSPSPAETFVKTERMNTLGWLEAKSSSFSPDDRSIVFSRSELQSSGFAAGDTNDFSTALTPQSKEAWSAHIESRVAKGDRVYILETPEHQAFKELLDLETGVQTTRNPLHSFLSGRNPDPGIYKCSGDIDGFFYDIESESEFIPVRKILGKQKLQPKRNSKKLQSYLSSFEKLSSGELVVHMKHGICRYDGIIELEVQSLKSDFLVLSFAGEDKIYLPVDRLGLLQKYGANQSSKLDKLGGDKWTQRKEKAQKEISDVAKKLIEAHAQRQSKREVPYREKAQFSDEVQKSFPYIETPDQMRCIEEIEADLSSNKLMDRLICGDVGFGKTEVALRAAVRAVEQGFQVMILVPTTVLSFQHFKTFEGRLKSTGISVGRINRFVKTKEAKETLEKLAVGEIDILIGTHRLFSSDVRWKNLGLLVVDEEQRFGVSHKEILKGYRKRTDVLTLSATPIPRTLQLSVLGLRDISLLQTPPVDRKPIKTYISSFDESLIAASIDRELTRNGQVFFLHNRVQGIDEVKILLERICPKARVRVAHGQQSENLLEKTLVDFVQHKFDVLLCTTIIESGIDIPNVNTILVNQAQKFGLSQLYQIRGRVGRDRAQAFAYFLTPDGYKLRGTARERLDVLSTYQELGAGFHIASHDLDIRGAGNILGSDQSGHAHSIGVDLYIRLLKEEISRQRNETLDSDKLPVELHLPVSYKVPQEYVPSINKRLGLYKQFFDAENYTDVDSIVKKTVDLYGNLPKQLLLLVELAKLKVALRDVRAQDARYKDPGLCILKFHALNEKELHKLVWLSGQKSDDFRVGPDMRLFINVKTKPEATLESQIQFCEEILGTLRVLKKKLR